MPQILRIWKERWNCCGKANLLFLWKKNCVRTFTCEKIECKQQRLAALPSGSLPVYRGEFPSRLSSLAFKIDGRAIAQEIRLSIAKKVQTMIQDVGVVPGLAVIFMGAEKASEAYVRNVEAACKEVGINIFFSNLSKIASEERVLAEVKRFNSDEEIHGVLVQLPLPSHIITEKVLESIDLKKDIDGLHPLNLGRLVLRVTEPSFLPCTPRGCLELLFHLGINLEQKHAVVIGSSNVGLPTALLLQRYNATVTVVHKHTHNIAEITKKADIVISATGQAQLVRGDWLKHGAVVIDVGISFLEDATSDKGYRLVGDVCFEEAEQVASAMTPVPGGVGPMTIAMLLLNTLQSANSAFGDRSPLGVGIS